MKYYLVRKPTQEILGPMTAKDIFIAFSKMQITTSDEVCGSLGNWVFLINEEKLAEVYPEIHSSVYKSNNTLINNVIQPQVENSAAASEIEDVKTNDKVSATGESPRRWVEIFILCGILLVTGFFVFNWKSKKKISQPIPAPGEVVDLYRETISRFANDWLSASSYVAEKQDLFLETMSSEPSAWDKLIPYVRLNAFVQGGGYFGNLTESELRGREATIPCIVGDWSSLFKASQVSAGKFNLKDALFRYLLLDANWLQSRWNEGWILPQNLEAACLLLGELAWEQSFPEGQSKKELEPIRRRFGHFKSKILGQATANVLTNHPLDIMSCIEDSVDLNSAKVCLKKNNNSELKNFFEIVAKVNAVRRGEVITGELPTGYPITNLLLEPEKRLLQELKGGKDLESAMRTTQEVFPEFINFQ